MTPNRRIAYGGLAYAFSRGVNIILGLVLMPALFRHLPKEELGVWLLLGQSWAAMGILDLGLGITLTRRIALAKGRSGGSLKSALTPESLSEIADLFVSGQRIYRILAASVFVFFWIAGLIYLKQLDLHHVPFERAAAAWTILCSCQTVLVWSTVWTCLLDGMGHVGWDAIIISSVNAATLAAQLVSTLCGGGLISLAIVATSGAVCQRWIVRWFTRRRRPELFAVKGRWNPAVLRGLPNIALRAWLTAIGGTLVMNSDPLFIASLHGAASIPAFRAALLLILNLHLISGVFSGASSVFVSHLWQANELSQIREILRRNALFGLLSMCCGGAVIVSVASDLFETWLGPGNFVGYPILIMFLLNFTLEHHANVFSTLGRATDDEAYAVPSLLSGVLKLALATVFMRRWGLEGLVAATLLSQCATTFWYAVYRGSARLGVRFGDHAVHVLVPCLAVLCLTLITCYGVRTMLHMQSSALRVAAAMLTGGVLWGIACWTLVLRPDQRQRWVARMRFVR